MQVVRGIQQTPIISNETTYHVANAQSMAVGYRGEVFRMEDIADDILASLQDSLPSTGDPQEINAEQVAPPNVEQVAPPHL